MIDASVQAATSRLTPPCPCHTHTHARTQARTGVKEQKSELSQVIEFIELTSRLIRTLLIDTAEIKAEQL